MAALLREKAILGGPDPRPLLSISSLFGELGQTEALIEPVAIWLASLYAHGARATLESAAETHRF
jgi:mannitol 2-dehydrogenase